MGEDNVEFLRRWEGDIREATGENSVDADQLESAAAELERLRSELKQAREIIGAFVQTNDEEMPLGLCDQVDNTGEPYQSQHFADLVARARAFLKEHEDA